MNDITELKRQGLSITAISAMTGFDRKTVRRYLLQPEKIPEYGPRPPLPSKLDRYKPYLEARLKAGVWNGAVLLRELRARDYTGGYTILKDWLQPQRASSRVVAVRRFETPPGRQAQVDWGHLGSLEVDGVERQLWGFTFTLGHSRMMMAAAALNQKLGTLLRMHETAFHELGGVPMEILYDRMRTVWQEIDDRGEVVWNPVFLDFARYWGFTPRLCRPYRAQTKGKVESGVKYVRRNFLCGLLGREPSCLDDLNTELRQWVWEVANKRVHGTTHQLVVARWDADQMALQPPGGRPPYPFADEELRKVARDAFVSWQGSRYSVPWVYAGKEVWVRQNNGDVEVRYGAYQIARHALAPRKHLIMRNPEHHEGIPLGARQDRKTLVHLRQTAPVVEIRPLEAYECVAVGGGL
ncbi:MAG: IS21 family transposase [Bryobacterales bacterium]|nr:IS21 family transposase [Bryobacterales bacterium]